MNLDHYLHAHIEARYDWEPDKNKCRPSYFYSKEQRYSSQYEYSEEKYGDLKRNIKQNLLGLMKDSSYDMTDN